MPTSRLDSLKIKAKLLQKAKYRAGNSLALKEAYEILAKAAGFTSWREMKSILKKHEILRPSQSAAHWNIWYSSYEQAKNHICKYGGFLLPYQKQFFVCNEDYILSLGIKLNDPDLKKVGRDWVNPNDVIAWDRLLVKISRRNLKSPKNNI